MLFADDGEKVISSVKKHSEINVVLLDIRMPKMNGFEIFKIIKELRPELPVIAQTAYAFSEDKTRIKAAGFDDYITKPINYDMLCTKLDAFLK
jgi:CheY-like chemotaxis protein